MAVPAKAASQAMPAPQDPQKDEKQGIWEALNDFVRPLDGLIEMCAPARRPLLMPRVLRLLRPPSRADIPPALPLLLL